MWWTVKYCKIVMYPEMVLCLFCTRFNNLNYSAIFNEGGAKFFSHNLPTL